jgi:YggT family protein
LDLIAYALDWVALVIFYAAVIVAGALVLRVILNSMGGNPFGRVSYTLTRWTEPLVRPFRWGIGGRMLRYDLIPIISAVMVLFAGFIVSGMFGNIASICDKVANAPLITPRFLIATLIALLGSLYVSAILLRFILPYFSVGYGNPLMRFLFRITEPLLKPLRRIRFLTIGPLDFSPFIAILLVQLVTSLLAGAID